MAFKLKDLIIDVFHGGGEGARCVPATIEPAAGGVHCGPATIDPAVAGAHCGPATIAPALATLATLATLAAVPGGAGGAQALSLLKRQLQEVLARIDEQERAQPEASLPSTLAEAEDLERRLKAALDELAEHKKKLQG
jgi:hypothetical protein